MVGLHMFTFKLMIWGVSPFLETSMSGTSVPTCPKYLLRSHHEGLDAMRPGRFYGFNHAAAGDSESRRRSSQF